MFDSEGFAGNGIEDAFNRSVEAVLGPARMELWLEKGSIFHEVTFSN
jgi:hypothetical protein